MTEWAQLISTLGFPIISAAAMFIGCRYLLDNQMKQTERMFDMYDKANSENREAIKACTEALNRLSEKLEDLG